MLFGSGEIRVGGQATPTAGSTVTLLDTKVMFGGMGLQAMGITRVKMSFPGLNQPSAAGGLIGYKKDAAGTYHQATFAPSGAPNAFPQTVAADTGTDSNAYDVAVSSELDVKFTFTASGTAPTAGWPPIVTLQYGNPQSG
jgi:hypothetical protein